MILLVPMSEEQYEAFMELSARDQMEGHIREGRWRAEEAQANMDRLVAQFLPEGLATPKHFFFAITAEGSGTTVGGLWYLLAEEGDTRQFFDGYIKLTVMGARWYDGQLGRWISPDTIIPDPANPQSFNRLSYVYNNPLRFVDPTGMFTEEELVGWGAYTLEEIEALRGSAWYAILMEAQLGDSVYFGNDIDYYTGPMGMGTFHLYEDTLYIGGDVSLWNQDRGGYESHKIWDSAQQWGELFGLASLQPNSYGLLPSTGSVYSAVNASFGIPHTKGLIGFTFTYMQDRDNACYFSGGLSFGESWPGISANWAEGQGPEPDDLEEYATGMSLNVNAGILLGGGYTYSFSTKEGVWEVGLYSPQAGFSVQYAGRIPCYIQLR